MKPSPRGDEPKSGESAPRPEALSFRLLITQRITGLTAEAPGIVLDGG